MFYISHKVLKFFKNNLLTNAFRKSGNIDCKKDYAATVGSNPIGCSLFFVKEEYGCVWSLGLARVSICYNQTFFKSLPVNIDILSNHVNSLFIFLLSLL